MWLYRRRYFSVTILYKPMISTERYLQDLPLEAPSKCMTIKKLREQNVSAVFIIPDIQKDV